MSPKRDPRHKPISVPRSRPRSQGVPQRPAPSPSYAGVVPGNVAPATVAAAVEETPTQGPGFRGLAFFRWIGSWQFLLLTTLALLTGTLAFAVTSLFRMPNLPNCRAIFWPTASAAMRLQCAESYADQGSVDFLLEAIGLVEKLPDDHPLRAEIDAKVETWSSEILEMADEQFHLGELERAIATAKQFGLRSNPTLRDTDLGTYYQIDPQQYASFRTLLEAAISPVSTDDVATRLRKLTEAVQILVRVSGGVAIALLISGSLCVLNGQLTLAAITWSASLAVSLVWMLQKLLVGSLL